MSEQPWREDNRVALENDAPRLDVIEKVTGKARYTTDYYPQNMIWAGYIRCPFGKAVVSSSNLDAARGISGVLEVELTKTDGRYHGDRLGHVCAESRAAMEQAIAALDLQFDVQDPVTDAGRAKTPLDQIESPDNHEQARQVLEQGEVIHEATYETQVQTHCCLEPHGALVDVRDDAVTAWGSTQGTFGFRDDLAQTLGVRQDQVEFHCEYVGGGFGSKFGAGAEGTLAAEMSQKYKRPCRVVLNRAEEQTDTGNRPGSHQYMKLAVSPDGKIQGGRIHTWGHVGPSGGGGGAANPSRYNFGTIARSHEDVHLNAGFPRAMRAPGHPQGMFAVSMMLEELAERLDMDPLQFRIKNDPDQVRQQMYRVGAELIGWDRRQPNGAGTGVMRAGFGIGATDWGNSAGRATVDVNVFRDGTVEVLSGSQDIGMGFRTMLCDCVASQLGVPREQLRVKVGVSTYPPGPASGGSVTSRFVAPKALGAAEQAKQAVLQLVADEWGVENPASLSIEGGVISDGQQTMPWSEACKLISDDRLHFSVSRDGRHRGVTTSSQGVQFVEVQVDTETGIVRCKRVVAIQEMGRPVNRNTAENQITGAVIQGMSFALFENRLLDRPTGAMVNPNMQMYKIAGPVDVPEIIPVIWKSEAEAGVNSLGEPPVVATPGAIGCAVYNAIGAPVRRMPITPDRVLEAIARGPAGGDA